MQLKILGDIKYEIIQEDFPLGTLLGKIPKFIQDDMLNSIFEQLRQFYIKPVIIAKTSTGLFRHLIEVS